MAHTRKMHFEQPIIVTTPDHRDYPRSSRQLIFSGTFEVCHGVSGDECRLFFFGPRLPAIIAAADSSPVELVFYSWLRVYTAMACRTVLILLIPEGPLPGRATGTFGSRGAFKASEFS